MTIEKENWELSKARLHQKVLNGQQGHLHLSTRPSAESPVTSEGSLWKALQGVLDLVDYLERLNLKQGLELLELAQRVAILEQLVPKPR